MSREDYLASLQDDIDPAKLAGEGWFATEEIARPNDVDNPWTRAEVGREGEYYPSPSDKPWMRGY